MRRLNIGQPPPGEHEPSELGNGKTGNAYLFLGVVTGLVSNDNRQPDGQYEIADIRVPEAAIHVRHKETGTLFEVSVRQIGGPV